MWPDNETDLDYLNFAGIGDTIAEIVAQADGRPISIGVSGAWGAGKSSLIKLTKKALAAQPKRPGGHDYVFVEFNAWLYQGYDDARAALMEVIATTLEQEAQKRQKGTEKVASLLRKVNWLRAAKLAAGSALALSLGLPPIGLIGEVFRAGKGLLSGSATEKDVETADLTSGKVAEAARGLLDAKAESSAPKEIRELRESFEAALQEMGVTLVVLIDDLDRCLPETTISTLEAIRLFLFLQSAAFVIAADDDMIRNAVRRHFAGISDAAIASYFDKLIQIPIRVPPLGTQEVRAYLMMLFVENSALQPDLKSKIRTTVTLQLSRSWEGKRVDRALVEGVGKVPPELSAQLDTAERLAPLMASAAGIAGNPRLIKRFLNALSIRMSISRAQNVGVDYAVLTKMLLLERMADAKLHAQVLEAVSTNPSGKPTFLKRLEKAVETGAACPQEEWDAPFCRAWLSLPPFLADQDLRGAVYVSREHAPMILPEDRLTPDGASLLHALLREPAMAGILQSRIAKLPPSDTSIIMNRLFERASQEQEWGAPPVLEACLVVSRADPTQGTRLGMFLKDRPATQIRPSVVPKIDAEPWVAAVFDVWEHDDAVAKTVKAAIATRRKGGNKPIQ